MEHEILKIALLQLLPENSIDGNLQKGIEQCRIAKSMGADIALFPEMWSCGYSFSSDTSLFNSMAIEPSSRFVQAFGALAAELSMAIGITFLEKYDIMPRNTIILFDRLGKSVLKYSKVHTCDFGDEVMLSAGNDFHVANLNTEIGEIKIGAMICFDREFPESARILMLKGAEIILTPNACPMEINRISQLRARAYENMLGIATVNYPKGKPGCNGHSTAFDGVAYLPNIENSVDTLIVEADESEGIYIAEFDMRKIRDYRRREVHGNAYRKPKNYKLLIDEKIFEPFIRDNKIKKI